MCPWLRRHMNNAVAADYISPKEVPAGELENHLRPAHNVEGPVCQFKGVVPDDSLVHLLALIGVLRYSLFVSLDKMNTQIYLQNGVASQHQH